MIDITFTRLTEAPFEEVVRILNEPRITRHMPLSSPFDPDDARSWISAKDSQWEENGYGPWAIMIDGAFAGWGGFQREEDGPDFGLVLLPEFWGSGLEISRRILRWGFEAGEFPEVSVLLPTTRRPERVLKGHGFEPMGEIDYDGIPFLRFRLTRAAWESGLATG